MRIIELELKTHLLSEMKNFYVHQLGFPLIQQTENSFTISAGNTKLTFVSEYGESKPFYHFAMNIPANQIHEAKDWLLQQGVQLIPAPSIEAINIQTKDDIAFFEGFNAHSIYFYDPSGNNVEFIARHHLDNTSNKPFDISSIINVSEIGFALENDLPKVAEILCSHPDVAPYSGDGKVFQMIGDDHGLFILGDISIAWYPTQRPPEIHTIRMTILGNRKHQFQLNSYPYFIRTTTLTD